MEEKNNTCSREDALRGDSKIYKMHSKIYEEFSQAEDNLGKISSYLMPLIKNRVVLDVGCGTGKFITKKIVGKAKFYYGVEPQKSQIHIARKKAREFNNCKLYQASGEKLPFKDNMFDIILATWVVGGIYNLPKRKKILNEMRRVLKENGEIYLVENGIGGDFKGIVEEGFGDKKTKLKLKWLEKNKFKIIKSIKTSFRFKSVSNAKIIFRKIWDKKISSKIKNSVISHNIMILKNEK